MQITCFSDPHGTYPRLKGGDLLIVAGDLTAKDNITEHSDFLAWLHKQSYTKKVLVAGNHDTFLEKNPDFYSKTDIDYLCNCGIEFEGVKIWGTPNSKWFKGVNPCCKAFMENEEDLEDIYREMPKADILVSHGPMWGMLDQNEYGENCGSLSLRAAVDFIKPKFFIFGHIHEHGEEIQAYYNGKDKTVCINCSIMNEHYHPTNDPIDFEYDGVNYV